MRNSTGWANGSRKTAATSGLRRNGINLILFGAFALVASGAASVASNGNAPMDVLMLIGVVMCLAGWRMVVVARRRGPSSSPASGPSSGPSSGSASGPARK